VIQLQSTLGNLEIKLSKTKAFGALLENYSFGDSLTVLVWVIFYPITIGLTFAIHVSYKPQELAQYPNYILFHSHQHLIIFFWSTHMNFSLYGQSKRLQDALKKELSLKLDELKVKLYK
jgi:hypothetical protein